MNPTPQSDPDRRDFLKVVCAGTVAAAANSIAASSDKPAPSDSSAGPMLPMGKIADLQLSRLILGTNHITFYMHSRDLRYVNQLSRAYNTEEKILETFSIAEAHGVNTFMTHDEPKIAKLFHQYRARGGKMKWIVAPWITPEGLIKDTAGYSRAVPQIVDSGADALYVPGMITSQIVQSGKGQMIGDMLHIIKSSGMPAGVASHGLDVIQYCEKEKFPVDFYVKTFHHLKYPTAPKPEAIKGDYAEVPGYWCVNPEETAEFMKGVSKPWVAFKVMAAGAIPPREAFKFAYSNGADFVLAGMFDFQIAEDVQIANETLASVGKRSRPWRS